MRLKISGSKGRTGSSPVRRTTRRSMKKMLIAVVMALAMCSAASAKDVSITTEFGYSGEAKDFNLYLNGSKVCSSGSGEVKPFQCNDISVEYGVNMFTLTATNLDDSETVHSPPFNWTYYPEIGESPVFVNIKVIIDGKTINLDK